ncbi:winged helix-turn-helix domain-containing protein [Croceicoccus sp. YJ47]|uniref:winged helix-turn-helix domain-containing protein n=1 Tax=Croceicoccus sp. YJ47 TaxID=2798724 RepID=UPI001920CB83|nr:LysR family transcriptional regulator [Croceicoccus sp. YJ47]QQN73792.1 LysR family transcriptional regulator [Croceicoccus sp. YJ47]
MRIKIKVQIYCGDAIAMGPGKAALLDAIGREGSISAAARALGMSYRRAWLLVDTMNRCFAEPLIATRPGGGADVTADGVAVLGAYRAMIATIDGAAAAPGAITRRLRAAPVAPTD